jgi:hypothetical protein
MDNKSQEKENAFKLGKAIIYHLYDGFEKCWVVFIKTFSFETYFQINYYNENQLVSHLVITSLRIKLGIFTQQRSNH